MRNAVLITVAFITVIANGYDKKSRAQQCTNATEIPVLTRKCNDWDKDYNGKNYRLIISFLLKTDDSRYSFPLFLFKPKILVFFSAFRLMYCL